MATATCSSDAETQICYVARIRSCGAPREGLLGNMAPARLGHIGNTRHMNHIGGLTDRRPRSCLKP